MKTTLDLILEEGYSTLTTNRIAQESNVNISSLYQYFPNKFSVVLAIYEKAASELSTVIHNTMLEEMTTPMEVGLPRIIKNLLDFIDSRQAIFMRLEYEVPELRQTAIQMSIDKMAYQVSCAYLKHHLPMIREASIRTKLFYCRHIGVSLVYGFLVDRPVGISRNRFITELSRILIDCFKSNSR